jgi:N-methylhydantoinase B
MNRPDAATVEILRNRLLAASEDMRMTLVRTAYTPTIYESQDCAIAILDEDANVLAQSTGLPIFLGNLEQAVADSIALRGGRETLRPGDIYFLNDSYLQGTHLQDVTTFAPIFADDSLVGYAMARAHMIDLGSYQPGGGMASTTIYHEGLRLGPIKLIDAGEPVTDMFDVMRRNSRHPDELIGDVYAMIAACQTGVERLQSIVARYGRETLAMVRDQLFEYSDIAARRAISRIPDGTYRSSGCLDDDGVIRGEPVWIQVTAHVDADRLHIDLDGTSPIVAGAINCGLAQTISSVRVAMRMLLGGDRPPDGGSFRTLTVSAPEGCFLNARVPAACGNYAASAVLLMDLVMKAFAEALPQQACAGQFGDALTEFIGRDPETGREFMFAEAHAGGWGAGEGYNGASGTIDLTNGAFRNFSIELLEARFPTTVLEYGYRRGSGGAGRFRGGDGIVRRYRVGSPTALYLWLDRTKTVPWGLLGGADGEAAHAVLRTAGGERTIFKAEGLPLDVGDEVTVFTAGGGGFGPADAVTA